VNLTAKSQRMNVSTLEQLMHAPIDGSPGPLTFDALRRANVERCNAVFHHLQTWSPTDWACALGGETGEALNLVKKLRRLDDGPDKTYNQHVDAEILTHLIGLELADIVTYADLLAARLGIDLGAYVTTKFNQVSRKVLSATLLPE
jgi:NTP pyrophosphatase (non-canonical NTP hydrolase)